MQGEELHCEDAFDMLGGVDKNTFKPVYGDLEYLTLVSFDGFEITRQVREGLDWLLILTTGSCVSFLFVPLSLNLLLSLLIFVQFFF